jgi:hypothetical protein
VIFCIAFSYRRRFRARFIRARPAPRPQVGTALVATATNASTLPISGAFGYSTLFGGYAAANLLIAAFVYCCIVETKGRTLEQIQAGK